MSRRWKILVAGATIIATAIPGTPPAAAALPAGGMSAAALNTLFNAYGNTSGRWSGADSTASVLLPDGRAAWLFSDTFLGTVNADFSRPTTSPFINNSIVVQDGTSLVATLHGGTVSAPESLVRATQAGEFYWVGDGTVDGGALRVLYNRYRRTGVGSLDVALAGTALVTFDLPGLTLRGITELPLGTTVGWGSAMLEDGGYTYVYGTEGTADGMKFAHLARVPAGGLAGPWQFWTGSGWSTTESASARLMSGVGTSFGIQKVNGQYVVVTQETGLIFHPGFVAYTAATPTGPFTGPVQRLTADRLRRTAAPRAGPSRQAAGLVQRQQPDQRGRLRRRAHLPPTVRRCRLAPPEPGPVDPARRADRAGRHLGRDRQRPPVLAGAARHRPAVLGVPARRDRRADAFRPAPVQHGADIGRCWPAARRTPLRVQGHRRQHRRRRSRVVRGDPDAADQPAARAHERDRDRRQRRCGHRGVDRRAGRVELRGVPPGRDRGRDQLHAGHPAGRCRDQPSRGVAGARAPVRALPGRGERRRDLPAVSHRTGDRALRPAGCADRPHRHRTGRRHHTAELDRPGPESVVLGVPARRHRGRDGLHPAAATRHGRDHAHRRLHEPRPRVRVQGHGDQPGR